MFNKRSRSVTILFVLLFISSCGTPKKPSEKISLQGSGSSFTLPYSSTFFPLFNKNAKININYLSENSYVGIEDLISNKTDFALSSIYLSDKKVQENPDILHIPVAAAGVNFAYNIPLERFSLQDDPVYLTPEILTKMITKKITHWNDPEIIAINKKVALDKDRVFPDLPITFIQRSVNSGDTVLLTTFLNKADSAWNIGITNLLPPIKGNIAHPQALDLMKELVQTPGGFTFTTMIYGLQNNIPLARIRNQLNVYGRGCNFRSKEAMKVADTNSDNRVDITYPNAGPESGVATGFMYILVHKEQNYNNRSKAQAQATVDFINWLLSPYAQRRLDPLFFASLTPKFRYVARQALAQMTYNGELLTPQEIVNKND